MIKNNPYSVLFRLMRKYSEKRKKLLLTFFFFLCANVISIFEPYAMGKLITTLQFGGKDALNQILMWLVIMGLLPLVEWVFHGTARVREEKMKFEVGRNFRIKLFSMVSSLPMSWHTDHHSGETIDQVNKAVDALQEFSGNNYMYTSTVMKFVSSVGMLVWIRPTAGASLFGMGLLIFWLVYRYDKILVRLIRERNTLRNKVSSLTFDYLSNIKTIITLRFEERVKQSLLYAINLIQQPFNRYAFINERKRFTVNMILAVVTSLIVGVYVYKEFSLNGVVVIGTVSMLFQYIGRMSSSFYNFAWQYSSLVQDKTNAQSIDHIVESYEHMKQKHMHEEFGDWKNIHISFPGFTYSSAEIAEEKRILESISLPIKKSQKIAFVGASGSGKSTLMMLLRGLYDVEDSTVKIDKKEINDIHVLASHTSLIPQDPEIFENTIRYNITVGTEVSEENLTRAMYLSAFTDVVNDLPQGLESDIREKGVNLSGGQKQRLALARGLLLSEHSDILLLDEPTSSVDPLTEQQIYTRIFEAYPKKTIISALHKLHLVGLFDMIYVFEQGRIVEYGTFEELVEKKERFAKMRSAYQQGMRNYHHEDIV